VYAVNEALNPQIAYWTFRLQDCRFRVVHRAKQRMMYVNVLSRIVECVNSMPVERELKYKQLLEL